jgi:hypothetical protein
VLFVGDDWAEDHHDMELVDEAGKVLTRKRLPEGLAGVTGLHALIAEHLPDPGDDLDPHPQVIVGIETERGPWVASLAARLHGVRAQPQVGGQVSGKALDLGGEVGCRGCPPTGGDRAVGPGSAPPGRR